MKFSCMLSQWQSFHRNLCVFNTLDKFPLKVWVKCASLTVVLYYTEFAALSFEDLTSFFAVKCWLRCIFMVTF